MYFQMLKYHLKRNRRNLEQYVLMNIKFLN